jgi:NhaP-type Na+/H+ or K+/H+ antiporter
MDRSLTTDRVLLGACAIIWLAVIGMSVAAIVALVELGSGHASDQPAGSQTPWGLYVVIAISAVVIIAAIPLLLRARRAAEREPARPPVARPAPARPAVEAPTEKLRVFGSVADPAHRRRAGELRRLSEDAVEKVWQRFLVSIANAAGAATLAVALATYCMGTQSDGWAVAALVFAGIFTVLMPVMFWRQLRRLPA